MTRAIRRVGWVAGALAVLVGSFWTTLIVLDRSDRVNEHAQDRSQPSKVVFSLVTQGTPNWSAATLESTTSVSPDGIVVRSTIGPGQYEFVTRDIPLIKTNAAKPYVLHYDITTNEGAIALGVLDAGANRWINTYPVVEHRGRQEFSTQADKIRLIVYNNGSGPTQITIARLELMQN